MIHRISNSPRQSFRKLLELFLFSGTANPIGQRGGGAVTVVYIDSVFVLNAVMDYLLLLVTGRRSCGDS